MTMTSQQRMFPARHPIRPLTFSRAHTLTYRPSPDEIAAGATAKCLDCGQCFRDADDASRPCPGTVRAESNPAPRSGPSEARP